MKYSNALPTEKKISDEILLLQEELQKAHELILLLKTENAQTIKTITHDLASPLQIISMSIEALIGRSPKEHQPMLERMENSAEKMTIILKSLRELVATSRAKYDV